jgi:uncharacterized protein (TIGR00255 family)
MTLSSMTGFGRAQGHYENYNWVWEIRSVNGKGLDVRLRIPPGLEDFDLYIKSTLKSQLARGNLNVSLQLHHEGNNAQVNVNEAALDKLVVIAKEAAKKHGLEMPSIDRLLSIRDVVEIIDGEDAEERQNARNDLLKSTFSEAIDSLKLSRKEEGTATHKMLADILDTVEILLNKGEAIAKTQPEALKDKFQEKVSKLLENNNFDMDRMMQEIVILATKADVKEETDRLRAHIDAARKLLNTEGPVGRKLEFLTQEFNREINTLCSKSTDIALTEVGLSLKTTIDQFREQILNVE